jgi:hypothetical protein
MRRCIDLQLRHPNGAPMPHAGWSGEKLNEAYVRCGEVTSEYAKTFYLGTQLMTPQQAKAIWAIYVWCRRTDELVDGPNASRITPEVRLRKGLDCNGLPKVDKHGRSCCSGPPTNSNRLTHLHPPALKGPRPLGGAPGGAL